MDFLKIRFIKESTLVFLVALMAIMANVPDDVLRGYHIEPKLVLAVLGVVLVFAVFLYQRLSFFLFTVLLVAGANLPDQWASAMGISQTPFLVALGGMILFALANGVAKLLPSGLEVKPRQKSVEGIRALMYGVEKDNLIYVQKVLNMNFDPNVLGDHGYSPLMYAAMRGNSLMVELLLRNGADWSLMSKDGDTALELALKHGNSEVADVLKRARQQGAAAAAAQNQPRPMGA